MRGRHYRLILWHGLTHLDFGIDGDAKYSPCPSE